MRGLVPKALGQAAGPWLPSQQGSGCPDRNSCSPALSRTLLSVSASDKRKQSLYFPEEMLKEIGAEATRQDRSLSWIVQKAWKAARKDLMSIPSVGDSTGEPGKSEPPK